MSSPGSPYVSQSDQEREKREAFKNRYVLRHYKSGMYCVLCSPCVACRLVDAVLNEDTADRVPMDKVVLLIWTFRDDPQVVSFMARFVAKVSNSGWRSATYIPAISLTLDLISARKFSACL
jgi:hypothetical protein